MKVTVTTPLINIETNEYPVFLLRVRTDNPNVSFPEQPEEEAIAQFGFAVVNPTDRPTEGDVITEGVPTLQDGKFVQTWNVRAYTAEEQASFLTTEKNRLSTIVENMREASLSGGFKFDFGAAGLLGVQLRPTDRTNLLGLRIGAAAAKNAGITDPILVFRTTENINVPMTPQQMVDMTTAALDFAQSVYSASWALKDQIDTATAIDQLPTIPEALVQ